MSTSYESEPLLRETEKSQRHRGEKLALHILMIGKGGVGKSSLANAILGSDVCPVAEPPSTDMMKYGPVMCNDVAVHVYDTRGLLDGEDDTQDIAKKISSHKSTFDIIIACIKFNDRFDLSNRMIFDVISKLGSDNWPKVCVALTHSDIVPPDWPRYEISEKFQTVLQQWRDAISAYLSNNGVPVHPMSHPQVTTLQNWQTEFIKKTAVHYLRNNYSSAGVYFALACPDTASKVSGAINGRSLADIDPQYLADVIERSTGTRRKERSTGVGRRERSTDVYISVPDGLCWKIQCNRKALFISALVVVVSIFLLVIIVVVVVKSR